MITTLLILALGYMLFKAYAALMPRRLENNLRKDKKLVTAIERLNESYSAMEKNLDDFNAKYPLSAITTARSRHRSGLTDDESHRVELEKIAEAGKAYARRQMSEGEMSEGEYAQFCAEIDERVSGEWDRKEAERTKKREEESNERIRQRRLQYYDNNDTYSMCSWCGGSLAGRSRDLGGYCSPKCRAEAKQSS